MIDTQYHGSSGQGCRVRGNILSMRGYAPGEQPTDSSIIKLNTNENPYPPSPRVRQVLLDWAGQRLQLYPDPSARKLRETAGRLYGFRPEQIIAGNGSDDLLTIGVRTLVDQGDSLAYVDPSYSLYPVLAKIQGAQAAILPLDDDFQLPEELPAAVAACPLLFIARPNAPTATSFPMRRMERLCRQFAGVVWIDEAYADFADDHCLGLVGNLPNVVVSRTLSKSYSLAGLRVGLAFAAEPLIEQMSKVKDSYNLSLPAQLLAVAALDDAEYMAENTAAIRAARAALSESLAELGFAVLPSQANFVFARPPLPASQYSEALRARGILVRYFPGERTGDYVRITVGRPEGMERLLEATRAIVSELPGLPSD